MKAQNPTTNVIMRSVGNRIEPEERVVKLEKQAKKTMHSLRVKHICKHNFIKLKQTITKNILMQYKY